MVFEIIKKIIAEQFGISENEVTLDLKLEDDLDADSLDLVDLVMTFEDEFKTEVPDEVIENIKTVGDIVKFIEEN